MRRLVLFLLLALFSWAQPENPLGPVSPPGLSKDHVHILPVTPVKIYKSSPKSTFLQRVGEFAPPASRGKFIAMVTDRDKAYAATTKGIYLLDLSDPAHPRAIRFYTGPWTEGIVSLALLDGGELLMLQHSGKVKLGYRGETYDATLETIRIVEFDDRPREIARNLFYLVDLEQTCNKTRTHRMLPQKLGRRLGRTILNDGYYGYGVSMAARGSDIYILRDLGLTHLFQGVEHHEFEGGSRPLHIIRLKKHIYLPKALSDSPDFIVCTEKFCKKEGGCKLDFSYAGGYLAVGPNVVVTPRMVLDRDLEKTERWRRTGSEKDHTSAGVLISRDEKSYLYDIWMKDGSCEMEVGRVDRTGRIDFLYSSIPGICTRSRNFIPWKMKLKSFEDYLLLYGCTRDGECLFELFGIDEKMRPQSYALRSVGPHKVVDAALIKGHLYILRDDSLWVFRIGG